MHAWPVVQTRAQVAHPKLPAERLKPSSLDSLDRFLPKSNPVAQSLQNGNQLSFGTKEKGNQPGRNQKAPSDRAEAAASRKPLRKNQLLGAELHYPSSDCALCHFKCGAWPWCPPVFLGFYESLLSSPYWDAWCVMDLLAILKSTWCSIHPLQSKDNLLNNASDMRCFQL